MGVANQDTTRRVVVTGLGVASPLGCAVDDFWSGLLAGRSGVRLTRDHRLANCRTQVFAPVEGFHPDEHFSIRELQRQSRTTTLALVAVEQALRQAKLDEAQCRGLGVGAILGGSSGGFVAAESLMKQFFDDGLVSDPFSVPMVMNSAPASNASIRFGLTGPVITLDAACASSAHAIGHGYELIRSGRLRAAVVGGSDSPLGPSMVHAWSSLRALSELNQPPHEACRPFSLDRDGMVLGEGAGILVLESEDSALNRNAEILAEISGYGAASDGDHMMRPSVEGMGRAMCDAIVDAGLRPDDIDYISAHATGTRLNDAAETLAIKRTLGSHAYRIPVVGIKAAIGHSIAASGAIECVSCVLSIRDQVVPPTLNRKRPDPVCDLDYVVESARACAIKHLISNSFAFGGSNAILTLSRYRQEWQKS
jgi:3-oxoacyl-(acyl-carrier-protein) synthase